jgi:hypothetical protein
LNATLVHSRVRPATGTRRRQDPFPEGPAGVGDNKSTTASTVYRGGGFGFDNSSNEQALKAFFVENTGKQYRVPQFLASSFNWEVAEDFTLKSIDGGQVASGGKTVLWKFEIDAVEGTDHAILMRKVDTHFPGEIEFLFSAYSVFTVVKTEWDTAFVCVYRGWVRMRAQITSSQCARL